MLHRDTRPALYYACTLPLRAGGELVNFQHVAALCRRGWRAFALLDASAELPSWPLAVPMVRWGPGLELTERDWLVVPEVTHPENLIRLAALPARLVIHNQNPFYTFRGVADIGALNALGLAGGLCCSQFTRDTLLGWGSDTDWQVVRPAVLPHFAAAAGTVQRQRQIAYMPRKRPAEAAVLQALFRERFPRWADVPWVAIHDQPRQAVARTLAASEVFASLSRDEGLGLPPLEAMAAGCLVCGFDGHGGREYATPDNGHWVADGDLEAFAQALAATLDLDEREAERRLAAGRATAAAFSQDRFESELDAAWRHLLGDEVLSHRLAPGEAPVPDLLPETAHSARFHMPSPDDVLIANLPPTAAERFNHGNAAFRASDWEAALAGFESALALQPDMLPAALQAARCLVHLNRLREAREAFARVLHLDPVHYSAWLEAGHLCRQLGELQQAAGAYQRAIDATPVRFEAHLAMARVLQQLGKSELAESAFAAALERASEGEDSLAQLAEVAHRMGQYRLELGDTAGAARALQTGLQALHAVEKTGAVPDVNRQAELRIDLGEAFWRQGRRDAALAVLTAASAATAEATLARLAALSFRLNLWQEALAVSRRNVELHPDSAIALWNLAHLQAECWQMDEAEALLQRAEALAPMPGATAMRASIAGRRGDADGTLRLYRELASTEAGRRQYASSAAMSSLYSDALSPPEVAALHRELFAPLGRGARPRDSFVRAPLAGRRLRLGLVTADFHHQHPVNLFMQPVLRELDRSRIELTVYFTGVSYDEQTRLAQRRAEHWVEATTLNDAQLARRIDADAIDLLLDLAGHTGQQRMSLFAQRAAPVQATYLGYPGSTGVPHIDWLIGDGIVTPPQDDGLYSERVMRLPETVFCYAPEADYLYPDYNERHAQRPLTFGSFNNVPKLTPRTLALWARVLDAVPDSRLLLKAPSFGDASAVRAFGDRLTQLGVDLARVEFRGPSGLDAMMAEYAEVDIALDPAPYNGGTTSLQAMWMGVPVLTLEGGHFVSRMGASFMGAAGLGDWVARDEDDYVQTAVRMAADRQRLLALKRGLRALLLRLEAWDPVAHTRALEQAFFSMAARLA